VQCDQCVKWQTIERELEKVGRHCAHVESWQTVSVGIKVNEKLGRYFQTKKGLRQGDLGVVDLKIHNKCLLSKWLFNLINTDGAWQQLLRNKYLGGKSITQVSRKPEDSHFWSGLINIF
jgi:hypothetical protein